MDNVLRCGGHNNCRQFPSATFPSLSSSFSLMLVNTLEKEKKIKEKAETKVRKDHKKWATTGLFDNHHMGSSINRRKPQTVARLEFRVARAQTHSRTAHVERRWGSGVSFPPAPRTQQHTVGDCPIVEFKLSQSGVGLMNF